MPVRLKPLAAADLEAALERYDSAVEAGRGPDQADVRALVKHYLAVLGRRAPGRSVEVRVPPYAAIQCVQGARHTRGTPPAVVETDAPTWIDLARGRRRFAAELAAGAVLASGERSDLSPHLPLD